MLRRYTGFEVACYAMWSATLFLLPLAPAAVRALTAMPAAACAAAIYLGLGPSALGQVTWGYAVARGAVATATAALLVAFAWLGEVPHPVGLLGGLLGVAGVIMVNSGRTGPG